MKMIYDYDLLRAVLLYGWCDAQMVLLTPQTWMQMPWTQARTCPGD